MHHKDVVCLFSLSPAYAQSPSHLDVADTQRCFAFVEPGPSKEFKVSLVFSSQFLFWYK